MCKKRYLPKYQGVSTQRPGALSEQERIAEAARFIEELNKGSV